MWKYLLSLTLVSSVAAAQTQPKVSSSSFDQAQRKTMARGSEADAVTTMPAWGDPRQQMERLLVTNAFTERQVQLRRDTEKLLALAAELKANVDKTSPSILSMDVIKKAQEIEKLAKSVKDKMKEAY